MNGEVYINEKDLWEVFSARLIDGSYDRLEEHPSMKAYAINDMRSTHGVQVLVSSPRVDSRRIVLTFGIHGIDRDDLRIKRRSLEKELTLGIINLRVEPLKTIYKLVATEESTFTLSSGYALRSTKLVVRLLEPNPINRKSTLRTAYVLSTFGKALTSKGKILTNNIE